MQIDIIEEYARKIRGLVIDSVFRAQSGHPGGSLSCADILAVLYGSVLRIDPYKADFTERDRFVLSKGHAAPAYYAALALRGYFSPQLLMRLRRLDGSLQGHPSMNGTPGVDMSTGSLGQGLSAAVGMALYAKAEQLGYHTFCLTGDGELQEGQLWEAAMTAPHYRLSNLTLLVDRNGLQIDGETDDVMNLLSIEEKLKSFGWHVWTADGHSITDIYNAMQRALKMEDRPSAIVFQTIKGKGVSYMENQAQWHGAAPNEQQHRQALAELGFSESGVECYAVNT